MKSLKLIVTQVSAYPRNLFPVPADLGLADVVYSYTYGPRKSSGLLQRKLFYTEHSVDYLMSLTIALTTSIITLVIICF